MATGQRRAARDCRVQREGFALIELLVVISIVALLLALLMPSLQRIRQQARAVACQANLRQWGVIFRVYLEENDCNLMKPSQHQAWPYYVRGYHRDVSGILRCPMAATLDLASPEGKALDYLGVRWGSTFRAWSMTTYFKGRTNASFVGSFGLNYWIPACYWNGPTGKGQPVHANVLLHASPEMPLLFDCPFPGDMVSPDDPPPAYDGAPWTDGGPLCCINRHDGAINSVFVDGAARRVGLKELWALKWIPAAWNNPKRPSPWTKAGGVRPEDWPLWMRGFTDY
jgi:prepilin-type N-terminal cleavage/methylation domain-containing protein